MATPLQQFLTKSDGDSNASGVGPDSPMGSNASSLGGNPASSLGSVASSLGSGFGSNESIGSTIGSTLGGFGGPVGAGIGAGLGGMMGGGNAATSTGRGIGTAIGMGIAGPVGGFIGGMLGSFFGGGMGDAGGGSPGGAAPGDGSPDDGNDGDGGVGPGADPADPDGTGAASAGNDGGPGGGDSGGGPGDGDGKIICTELYRRGLMPADLRRMSLIGSYKIAGTKMLAGYHVWAYPCALAVRDGRWLRFWSYILNHRAKQMGYLLGFRKKRDWVGIAARVVLEGLSWGCYFVIGGREIDSLYDSTNPNPGYGKLHGKTMREHIGAPIGHTYAGKAEDARMVKNG